MNEVEKIYVGYIYKFTNTVTNKIYVGKRERSKFDENYYGSGSYWTKSIKGLDKSLITREILEWSTTHEALNEAEIYWINRLNSRDPRIGYNIHKGGQGGCYTDPEMWSYARRGDRNGRYGKEVSIETRLKIGDANRGKRHSDEINKKKGKPGVKKPEGFGLKISKALKGKIVSEETRKKIGDANRGKSHPIKDETRHKISKALTGRIGLKGEANGMYGRHHTQLSILKMKDNRKPLCGSANPRARKVICLETGLIYDCIKDAQAATGLTTIDQCCRGCIPLCRKNRTHWKYYNEN